MHIVVVGGSIGGLTAAIALRRGGADVTVLERRAAMEDQGTGLALRPAAIEALATLGVTVTGKPLAGWRYAASIDGYVRARLEWGAPVTAYTYAALRGALAARAEGVEVRMGARVTEIARAGTGAIVRLGGDGGGGAALACDLVVAADGVESLARAALGFDAPALYTGIAMWRGFVHEDDARRVFGAATIERFFDVNTQIFAAGASGWWLGVLIPERAPGAGRRFGWVLYAREDEAALGALLADEAGTPRRWGTTPGDTSAAARDRLREILAAHFPAPLASLADVGAIGVHKVAALLAPRMAAERICLVGDAAHVVPPYTTAGATLAIGDGIALAEKLATSPSTDAALAAYDVERRAAAAAVVAQGEAIALHTVDRAPDLARASPGELTAWARRFVPPGTDRFLRTVDDPLWEAAAGPEAAR